MKTRPNKASNRQKRRLKRKAAAKASKPTVPERSQSQELRGVELLEEHDSFAYLRNGLAEIAQERGNWAGIPMPLDDERLIIEPTYPKAKELSEIGVEEELPVSSRFEGLNCRNHFHCIRRRFTVYVFDTDDGKVTFGLTPDSVNHLDLDLRTMGCSVAWGIEQERKALDLLATLLPHNQMKNYLLTGSFLEKSRRSGIYYFFRRLKPTAAIAVHKDSLRTLCTLCLHPIAHYASSWAGAMCPTDDVIAHLMMMRGDEAMFWRRANQHAPWTAEAGL